MNPESRADPEAGPSRAELLQKLETLEAEMAVIARDRQEARDEAELLDQQLKGAKQELHEARRQLLALRRSMSFEVGQIIGRGLKRPSLDTVLIAPRIARRVFLGSSKPKSAPARAEHVDDTQTPEHELLAPRPTERREGVPLVASILDTFTKSCLAPECDLMSIRPDNWQAALAAQKPDFLLVESAWHGNDDAWQYRVASYQAPPDRLSLPALLKWCRKENVPTLFWNKEDPVHFERFIQSAQRFDGILTTDADCVPRYCRISGHQQVAPMAFAAQPKIHHPLLDEDRNDRVCFAGSFYGNRHDERRVDMESILRPALDFPFDIFDRNHGVSGPAAEKVAFPEVYRPAIRGRLEYDEMVRAYRRYRVFLNVNSVKASPTMFSRRVFELLACGTPVISSYSRGIVELLGEDTVALATTPAETKAHLERLLGDPEIWARTSVTGLSRVLSAHTYRDRLTDALASLGHAIPTGWQDSRNPRIVVVSRVSDDAQLDWLGESIARQSRTPASVLVQSDADLSTAAREKLANRLKETTVRFTSVSAPLDEQTDSKELVAVFEPGAHYANCYLEDAVVGLRYAPDAVMGRGAAFRPEGRGSWALDHEESEHRLVAQVPAASLIAVRERLGASEWSRVLRGQSFQRDEGEICSLHRFNFATSLPSGVDPSPVELDWRRG